MWTPADIEEETNPLSIIQKGVRLCEECDDDENVWVFFSYHERILPSTMTTATGNNQKRQKENIQIDEHKDIRNRNERRDTFSLKISFMSLFQMETTQQPNNPPPSIVYF